MIDAKNSDREQRFEAVIARYLQELDQGRSPSRERYLVEHQDLERELRAFFAGLDRMEGLVERRDRRQTAVIDEMDAVLIPGAMLGQYRVEGVIGRGAMGTVYKATHGYLQRHVAIKVLPSKHAHDPQFVDRFKREARALAQLQHPNIVAVHDMGAQNELFYFVMEFVDGLTLRQLIEQRALSAEQALSLVPKICRALEYAHEQGIVHRDIKPENILVDRSGAPKIADFGLARLLHGAADDKNLTRTSMVMGTLNYMAPEQRVSAAVDHRADIYALGVVLYEMLTGQLPGEHFAPPSERLAVDHRIDGVVSRALARDPELRYQRADHMGRDVTSVIAPDAVGARPSSGVGSSFVVFHGETGERIGSGLGTLRLVATSDEAIKIIGWAQPDVMVNCGDEPPEIESPSAERSALQIKLPADEVTVHVPAGLSIELEVSESEVEILDLRNPMTVRPAKGSIVVKNHRGPLHAVCLGDGELTIEGLDSQEFELRTNSGALSVVGLRFKSGHGMLHTQDGEISVGVVAEESGFTYYLRSIVGKVTASIGTVSERTEHHARGKLGEGSGHLTVETTEGEVKLDRHQSLVSWLNVYEQLDALDGWVFALTVVAVVLLKLKWWWILVIPFVYGMLKKRVLPTMIKTMRGSKV